MFLAENKKKEDTMDPLSIALIVTSAVSSFTAVISIVVKKFNHKQKHQKKITTKITEGDVVKKHNKSKDKLDNKYKNNKNEDESDHGFKFKDKPIAKIKVKEGSSNEDLKSVAAALNIDLNSDSSASSLNNSMTEMKFKQIEIIQELTSESDYRKVNFGGRIKIKGKGDQNAVSKTDLVAKVGEMELVGKNIDDSGE
ncbi:MAG: hypothetical protein K0Q51_674 [Rickettsiaceae bacterium]|jgi:hypothetical protein|nr:hypothetical protein [Rickettsiaceae bacterium]